MKFIMPVFLLLASAAVAQVATLSNSKLQHAIRSTNDSLTIGPSGNPFCLPAIDQYAKVHVVSTYKGGQTLLPSVTRHPPAYADVNVIRTREPVFLVLAGYEPIVWRLSISEDARIAGIFLTGQYPQMALGIPPGTNVGSFSAEQGSWRFQADCELPNNVFKDSQVLKRRLFLRSYDAIRTIEEANVLLDTLRAIGEFDLGSFQFDHGNPKLKFVVSDG